MTNSETSPTAEGRQPIASHIAQVVLAPQLTQGEPRHGDIVRAALVQASWTGDQETMIQQGIDLAKKAGKARRQGSSFQELFTGPYFSRCRRRALRLRRADPRRSHHQTDAEARQGDRHGADRPDVRNRAGGLLLTTPHR